MNPIGIMQGRLSPAGTLQAFPWLTWQDEFPAARACGFAALEWLVTADRLDDNPLWQDADAIRRCQEESGVAVGTLCADCFIGRPLVGVPPAVRAERLALLDRIVAHAAAIGVRVVVLPLLEGNAVADQAGLFDVRAALAPALDRAADRGVRIAIECDRPAAELAQALDAGPGAAPGVCYDLGNAAAGGRDGAADLRLLGTRVLAVHVKDRRRGGPNVSLGDGDVDFGAVMTALAGIGYAGSLVLETPRGDDAIAAARRSLQFVREYTDS